MLRDRLGEPRGRAPGIAAVAQDPADVVVRAPQPVLEAGRGEQRLERGRRVDRRAIDDRLVGGAALRAGGAVLRIVERRLVEQTAIEEPVHRLIGHQRDSALGGLGGGLVVAALGAGAGEAVPRVVVAAPRRDGGLVLGDRGVVLLARVGAGGRVGVADRVARTGRDRRRGRRCARGDRRQHGLGRRGRARRRRPAPGGVDRLVDQQAVAVDLVVRRAQRERAGHHDVGAEGEARDVRPVHQLVGRHALLLDLERPARHVDHPQRAIGRRAARVAEIELVALAAGRIALDQPLDLFVGHAGLHERRRAVVDPGDVAADLDLAAAQPLAGDQQLARRVDTALGDRDREARDRRQIDRRGVAADLERRPAHRLDRQRPGRLHGRVGRRRGRSRHEQQHAGKPAAPHGAIVAELLVLADHPEFQGRRDPGGQPDRDG